MIIAPYRAGFDYDVIFENLVSKSIPQRLKDNNDDNLWLCCGTTGSGKTGLGLHAEDMYMKDKASVDFIGLDKKSFADALQKAKDSPKPRFCMNDEANISKRDSLTKYNKDLIDLYLSIRGLGIFHWWNNPSADLLDKHFVEERIKGLLFITTKDTKRPRIYYYFRKSDLLKIWEKYGNLKLDTLRKIRKEYAYYRGWFREYKGPLLERYLEKKNSRMDFKVDDFFEKYGGADTDKIKASDFAKLLSITTQTVSNCRDQMLNENLIDESDVITSPTGYHFYKPHLIPIFEKYIKDKRSAAHKKTMEGLKAAVVVRRKKQNEKLQRDE